MVVPSASKIVCLSEEEREDSEKVEEILMRNKGTKRGRGKENTKEEEMKDEVEKRKRK